MNEVAVSNFQEALAAYELPKTNRRAIAEQVREFHEALDALGAEFMDAIGTLTLTSSELPGVTTGTDRSILIDVEQLALENNSWNLEEIRAALRMKNEAALQIIIDQDSGNVTWCSSTQSTPLAGWIENGHCRPYTDSGNKRTLSLDPAKVLKWTTQVLVAVAARLFEHKEAAAN